MALKTAIYIPGQIGDLKGCQIEWNRTVYPKTDRDEVYEQRGDFIWDEYNIRDNCLRVDELQFDNGKTHRFLIDFDYFPGVHRTQKRGKIKRRWGGCWKPFENPTSKKEKVRKNDIGGICISTFISSLQNNEELNEALVEEGLIDTLTEIYPNTCIDYSLVSADKQVVYNLKPPADIFRKD